MLIDGAWVGSASGRILTVENPAKRRPIAEIPRGDAADVNGAVEAAARAFPAWSKVAPRDRGRLLLRIADKMESQAKELARLRPITFYRQVLLFPAHRIISRWCRPLRRSAARSAPATVL